MPPKPEINKIQPIAGPELDRTTEMSNSAARPGETPVLTDAEWERLYRAIDRPRDRAIFPLAYQSEVGLLQMRDYQPGATVNGMDRIYVHRLKGSHSGDYHLALEEARALSAWLKIRGDHPGPILCSNRARPISRSQLHKLMRQYGAIAELPERLHHFRVLKHTRGARRHAT